ncbi:MAG: hypothetical protein ACNA7U_01450 [Candidatus Izemoplasmataceae bacterium]|jgi:hypothetical protein|uniref:hypothetical protein n=1 Tax=Liberiplasma polymorphum TaxID=3374570 RepID=UPI003775B8D2
MSSFKTSFAVFSWVFKFVGAALLIGLALVLFFMDLEHIVEAFIGILIAGYALMRLVPLIKTQRSDLIKTINIIESVLNLLVAVVFIGNAIVYGESLETIFGWLFAGVLIGRGMVHFYGISDGNEKGDHPSYFFHIATLIVGTIIITQGWDAEQIVYLMLFLSIVSGSYLSYDAYGGYNLYRRRKQLQTEKRKEVEIPDRDVPRKEDPVREQDQIIS